MKLEIQSKNGLITPVLYNASIYKDEDNEVIGVFAAARDITERKKAEESLQKVYENLQLQSEELQAQSEELQVQNEELQVQSEELHEAYELLRETEERFRTLTENSPDIITRFDRQNHYTYANPAAAELYGCSQEEIIGKTVSELGMDRKLVEFWKGHYNNIFSTGKPETMEFNCKSLQGKEYYFNTRIVPEFVNGNATSVLAISRDITDIKQAEEILKLKLEELSRSNAELEQFAYVSSHDLQEPLRMISSYLQLLQRRYQGKIDDKADKYIYYAVNGAVPYANPD